MLRVQDVMTRDVKTVSPDTGAEAAFELMRQKGFHHLVVTRKGDVVGLLSERDLGGRRRAVIREGHTVGELMAAKPVTVRPDATVRQAANLMRGRSIGSLVVLDQKGRLDGIITASDLLELLGRGAERVPVETKRWTLKHRVPHRKRHAAPSTW